MQEVTQLTPELIESGEWRKVIIKEYNVRIPGPVIYPGRIHPLREIIEEVRKIFVSMGFKEIYSPYVESAFWNFDALFQPQDHPARELHDTFYLRTPKIAKLPDKTWVENVRKTHEQGGETGSTGWHYKWDENTAKKTILRTHTTATTVRYLAQHPKPPQKVFTVSRVFRAEKVDYTHLADFHQVDGIIISHDANLSTLFGLLKEFFARMGFKEIQLRRGYFPYTEPSVEVFVKFNNEWLEMAGAGIFRPEVTYPFGCKTRVLAWGMGLERLAMLRLGLTDIRKIYDVDIDWLRNLKLLTL